MLLSFDVPEQVDKCNHFRSFAWEGKSNNVGNPLINFATWAMEWFIQAIDGDFTSFGAWLVLRVYHIT